MPHPTKKQRLDDGDYQRDVVVTADSDFVASFDDLTDVLPNILGFLSLKEIMSKRRLNIKSREAVKKTIVPLTDFWVDDEKTYNAMCVMTRALPNLQQIKIGLKIGQRYKYNDGEDPERVAADPWAAETAHYTAHDIGIISNFSKLRDLELDHAPVNGRYPFLFSSFPLLQKLSINECGYLKWDLEMLVGFPLLKELVCNNLFCYSMTGNFLTGNIRSLSVLKDKLEKVTIEWCENVEGNFMDLADFPHLRELNLLGTAVTGDIRDIGENDFSSLEQLTLPKEVYGGSGYEFQRISDGHDLMRAVYLLKTQRPALTMGYWYVRLSRDSPDWYEYVGEDEDGSPPFYIRFVEAGSRVGYRWETANDIPCEVNWLVPEPDRESSDYEEYIEELQEINSKVNMYKGFHEPPTEEEYHRLSEEYNGIVVT
jgi:hypothetical protein